MSLKVGKYKKWQENTLAVLSAGWWKLLHYTNMSLIHHQLVHKMSTSQHGIQSLAAQTGQIVESLHSELCLKNILNPFSFTLRFNVHWTIISLHSTTSWLVSPLIAVLMSLSSSIAGVIVMFWIVLPFSLSCSVAFYSFQCQLCLIVSAFTSRVLIHKWKLKSVGLVSTLVVAQLCILALLFISFSLPYAHAGSHRRIHAGVNLRFISP